MYFHTNSPLHHPRKVCENTQHTRWGSVKSNGVFLVLLWIEPWLEQTQSRLSWGSESLSPPCVCVLRVAERVMLGLERRCGGQHRAHVCQAAAQICGLWGSTAAAAFGFLIPWVLFCLCCMFVVKDVGLSKVLENYWKGKNHMPDSMVGLWTSSL